MNTNDTMKLVPVEPTTDMILAGFEAQPEADTQSLKDAYKAMLEAAPSAPQQEQRAKFSRPLDAVAFEHCPPAPQEPQTEQSPTLEPVAMTDEWLVGAMKRAFFVSGSKPDDPAANVLRGFANRVLQQFGSAEGMREALNVAYTNQVATPQAAMALLVEAQAFLRVVQEAAVDMRGDDFNLTSPQWADFHALMRRIDAHLGKGKEQP